jgi:hypothetical protein
MSQYASGNIFIREGHIEEGELVVTHKHNFDHTTYIAKGQVKIEQLEPITFDEQGEPVEYKTIKEVIKNSIDGQNWVLIKAGVYHRITAITPTTYHCIYSHRDPGSNDIVQDFNGWQEAYS